MAKIFTILTERYNYTAQTSLGQMYFEYGLEYVLLKPQPIKELFGNTLEDTARPDNIKVYGETCLPGGLKCDVSLYESPRHGKTIIFHTEDDGVTIKFNNLIWDYCLAHGGATHKDTAACVLIGSEIVSMNKIQGSLKGKLRKAIEKKIEEGYTIKARFVNLNQES